MTGACRRRRQGAKPTGDGAGVGPVGSVGRNRPPPPPVAPEGTHGLSTTRPNRVARQPDLPRDDELRAAHERARRVRHHGSRARARHQLLRHREPLRRAEGPGHDRGDHRSLVRAGRRAAREGRARDQGVRPDDRMAERRRALRPPHPRRVRREPAPAADRPHRPLPDAPRRPRRVVGRDLAGDGDARRRRARSSTSAAATSRAGTSRRRTKPPSRATSSGSSASRASTTSHRARSSSRCSPRAATTGSA